MADVTGLVALFRRPGGRSPPSECRHTPITTTTDVGFRAVTHGDRTVLSVAL